MKYKEYYEEELKKALEAKEAEAWKNFYNKTLPKRLEEFEKSFPGSPAELEVALTGRERFLVSCQKKEVETALEAEKGRLMQSYLEDAIERLDHMKSTPEKEEKPLASEIIAEQAAEVEKLKAELQETEELRDLYYLQKSVCQMQLDIVNFITHIYSKETLSFIYGIAKSTYTHQFEEEQEEENRWKDAN